MCRGTTTYYVQCGHSAILWRECQLRRFRPCVVDACNIVEEFRDEACGHRWCLADGHLWNCCGCGGMNKWGDCITCTHVKCQSCSPTDEAPGTRGHSFQDPRYLRWKRRYVAQQRARGLSD